MSRGAVSSQTRPDQKQDWSIGSGRLGTHARGAAAVMEASLPTPSSAATTLRHRWQSMANWAVADAVEPAPLRVTKGELHAAAVGGGERHRKLAESPRLGRAGLFQCGAGWS